MSKALLSSIGHTPLVALKMSEGLPARVLVKLENRNPGGSIKDRVAVYLLEQAMHHGQLKPGCPVVEATSGNMGIGLALVCAVYGIPCILTMPESMSLERRRLLQGLGAELVLTPKEGGMKACVQRSQAIAAERHGYIPGQFTNPLAVEAHYTSTGPEIDEACQGCVDMLIAGVGSGSSLSGTGRFLKERTQCQVVAVEPEKSCVLSGGKAGLHGIQGIGAGFVPEVLDRGLLDDIVLMADDEAIGMARRLMREEGILAGISSGANVAAAMRMAKREEMRGKTIVTFICDCGERYLSTALFS